MSECIEMYVYEINPELVEEFLEVKDQLITEARSLPGLVQSATYRSQQQDNVFIDRMRWEDTDAAVAGLELFAELPTSARFMALMTGPPLAGGRFNLIAGN